MSRPTSKPARPTTGLAGTLAAAAAVLALLAVLLMVAAGTAMASGTTIACSLYVAPGGSDGLPGSAAQPFATVQHLADTLAAGQTGCVRGGSYTEDVTVTHAGQPGAPITITSYTAERATLTGRLWVHQGADYVTVANMNLDGRNTNNLPSPDINAAHTTFTGNDVTDEHTAICFDVGSDTTYGRATSTLIQDNRIHDCGTLPAANHDHGIYVESSTGATIIENVIYKNADRGIQLYPDAQNTLIERNIIDSNGEGIIFSGDFGLASGNNTVANNLITNATLRYDIESWYPEANPIGTGNTVQHNCVWAGAKGTIQTPESGYTATNNLTTNPQYANPTTGDYRINSTSPCANLLANTTTPTQPFTTTSTTTYEGPKATSGGSTGSGGSSGSGGETETSGTSSSGSTPSESTTGTGTPTETTKTSPKHHHHSSARAVTAVRRHVAGRRSIRHHRAKRARTHRHHARH